jgi:adenosine deaminase
MGMSLRDIKTIIIAGFKSAFLPFHVKQAYLRRVSEDLSRFNDDGTVRAPPPAPSGRSLDAFLPRRAEAMRAIGSDPSNSN